MGLIYSIKCYIRSAFCKHQARYDKKWCNWFCKKCGKKLYANDLPNHVWRKLTRPKKTRTVKRVVRTRTIRKPRKSYRARTRKTRRK
ncbi:hypothetical protein HN933_00020 [Candidatus Woesearchaeota archaeon]|jgi:hypothetical protein|nr:hypothetical protein [Candidatus Woesearchaeota archaeon]MBT7105225.1 hypothetical protein [Candidatus Woesearchaeota archaeon]